MVAGDVQYEKRIWRNASDLQYGVGNGGFICFVRMLNHFMSDYALMILLFHSNIVVKQ